jgi:hypothetical protein
MSNTRRHFIQTAAGVAAGLTAGAPPLPAQAAARIPDSDIKVPKIKFGKVELSRLILGVNPFYGFAHFNGVYGAMMKEWYTAERVVGVLRQCEKYGVNGYNYVHMSRAQPDWERYLAESGAGKMHIVAQGTAPDPTEMIKAVKPMAVWVQGERTDNAYQDGELDTIREYCKKMRDLGVMVGVGTHIPEVLETVVEKNWDVDFYAGCVYNRRRTHEELRKLLGGELPEMPSEVYLQDDPPRMYKVFRQISKPCFAFKIMAAGRKAKPEEAFKLAFESIKPTDFVCVGVFPRIKDEVKENAYWTSKYGVAAS